MDFKELTDTVAAAKELFEAYLKDTTQPLEERWDVFVKAPDYLKNDQRWCSQLDPIFGTDVVGYDCTVHMERYETRDAVTMYEWLTESARFGEDKQYLDEVREKILQHNLGDVTYDW